MDFANRDFASVRLREIFRRMQDIFRRSPQKGLHVCPESDLDQTADSGYTRYEYDISEHSALL
jgi:hypothetical protein